MGNQQGTFLTAIDVGSAKTCALMAEVTDIGLRYRGHGVAESRGSRKGVIVELDKAVAAIQKAVEAAEDIAGAPVENAIVGIGGAHVRGVNSHGASVWAQGHVRLDARRSSWRWIRPESISTTRCLSRLPLPIRCCVRMNAKWACAWPTSARVRPS